MIEFRNVCKVYNDRVRTQALKDVNIKIDKGEFVFIVGSSGAGKSTFLKLIMHEEVPTSGQVVICGKDIGKMKRRQVPYLRRTMGIVFQDFRLIDKMNVFDNVAFAMRVIGADKNSIKKRVNYILDLVGLRAKAKSRPCELSGGEQQRVSLARALVNNPAFIIADEPTGNIDPELSYDIMNLLKEINKAGATVIVVTHEQNLVSKFNARVIEMKHGEVVKDTGKLDNDNFYDDMNDYDDYDNSDCLPDILNYSNDNNVVKYNDNLEQTTQDFNVGLDNDYTSDYFGDYDNYDNYEDNEDDEDNKEDEDLDIYSLNF